VRPHEAPGADTRFIKQEPDMVSLPAWVDQGSKWVTCFHCQETAHSCHLGANDAHQCLVAQGWFKSIARRNWSCPNCAGEYWVAPHEDLVKCCHLETLQYRKRGMIEWQLTPEAAAETPEAVLTDIALELELTGNRLVRLAARLRSATAQRSPVPE
jgi:hypothetical protein